MKFTKEDWAILKILFFLLAFALMVLYVLVSAMSVVLLRVCVMLSPFTALLALFIGWRLGTRDSRAHISGLDKGIGAMLGAASKAADLSIGKAMQVRQIVQPPQQPPPALPRPQVTHIRQIEEGDVVDL